MQFHEAGCDNCPFFQMEGDKERVADCTTPNFQSLITVMEPNSSWAAKWLHVSKRFLPHPTPGVSGFYVKVKMMKETHSCPKIQQPLPEKYM